MKKAAISLFLMLLLSTAVNASSVTNNGSIWSIENRSLLIKVDTTATQISITDKISGYEWKQPDGNSDAQKKFDSVKKITDGISFIMDCGWTKDHSNSLNVNITLPGNSSDVVISADMQDKSTKVDWMPFFKPFILNTPDGMLAIADYSNGHLYPLNIKSFPVSYIDANRLDMPWIGIYDEKKGFGYALIVDTSDDAYFNFNPYKIGDNEYIAPQFTLRSSKNIFGYTRKIIYTFVSKGGYVSIAKAYRKYADKQGLIVPFSEKLKKNPNIARLFGAPDVWGDASLSFARQAKLSGVDKMLIHGRTNPKDMKAINALGYLTSEYDNYTDIMPIKKGEEPASDKDVLPDAAVMNEDNTRLKAWLTWDKQIQYMKRCPALWAPTADKVISKLLKTYPYIGRFIDVTPAEGLYECYDPNHPLTKGQKRQAGVDLLRTVRQHGLVVGGEHGIWWSVPVLDYVEGMMSGGHYSWPAGWLLRPETKSQEYTYPGGGKTSPYSEYEQYGIGYQYRAPLWELVFHDCIVTTWYWGDSSDYLLKAAPEVTPRKDAFNILYGTMPMMWADKEGSWKNNKKLFLTTYRNVCRLHEAIAGRELISHEFLTEDKTVQRTIFSDGTTAVVNFGEKPYTVLLDGKKHVLGQNGFAVKGPKISQSMELVNGKPITTIKSQGYMFTNASGSDFTVQEVSKNRIRVIAEKSPKTVVIYPEMVDSRWDNKTTLIYSIDDTGSRITSLSCKKTENGGYIAGPFDADTRLEMICGSETSLPDIILKSAKVPGSSTLHQGKQAKVSLSIANIGSKPALGVVISLYADSITADRKLWSTAISLSAGQSRMLSIPIDTTFLDGNRKIIASASYRSKELCTGNNLKDFTVTIVRNNALWKHSRLLDAFAANGDTVSIPFESKTLDPGSVRVIEVDSTGRDIKSMPAQFDSAQICFEVTEGSKDRTPRSFRVLWSDKQKAGNFIPAGVSVWNSETNLVNGETYQAYLDNGYIRDVSIKNNNISGKPFIDMIIFSSAETGWVEEPGKILEQKILTEGPVKTAICVKKALKSGVEYERIYTFYRNRFNVKTSLNRILGVFSRVFYGQEGNYADNQGYKSRVDGTGNDENVSGRQKDPKWYCVYSDKWAHSCLVLTKANSICYWDGGSYGGIGFTSDDSKTQEVSYVFHPGAFDESFAGTDYDRYVKPVVGSWK